MSPVAVVEAQLAAFNAKDLDGLLATYAPNAQQFALHGALLAEGHAALRERYALRFAEPDLHARLISRSCIANIVVDAEIITRNFPEGVGTLEMLCVYEVADGRIVRASFAPGLQTLS